MELTKAQRKQIRRTANADTLRSNLPVKVIPGDSPPVIQGETWRYETKNGMVIRHPMAYSKRGWSNMVYFAATMHIEVGAEWLANQEAK